MCMHTVVSDSSPSLTFLARNNYHICSQYRCILSPEIDRDSLKTT